MREDLVDTSQAVEIAPRVWWVGSIIPGDRFQCHAYLIEQGDQSVLIDPGSALITEEIIRKIESVTALGNVRWLVCSHADPDIIGSLPGLVAHGLHPDAHIVTFWRSQALIVHSGTTLPFWRIEDHDWQLQLEDRTLQFILTPYLHFAGAFNTYDESTRTLFSSDLFGGFTLDPHLFASSMDYFNAIRAFHEHYMPSREILANAISSLRELPLERIAPQHGQIIPHHLIDPIMDRLETLECGVYLLARNNAHLRFLMNMNEVLKGVVDVLISSDRFSVVATHLAATAAGTIDSQYLEVWATRNDLTLHFHQEDGYCGVPATPPTDVAAVMRGEMVVPSPRLILPVVSTSSGKIIGAAVLGFEEIPNLNRETMTLLAQVIELVEVGLEKEMTTRAALEERAAWRKRAMHDSLTGLLNRVSLDETFDRVMSELGTNAVGPLTLAALMIDIDHFKVVNDSFGHTTGDQVLQHVASSIATSIRPSDFAFRYGGEEFFVLLVNVDQSSALAAATRIRERIAQAPPNVPRVTASIGIAMRTPDESLHALVERADGALYRAKAAGRDRVCSDN